MRSKDGPRPMAQRKRMRSKDEAGLILHLRGQPVIEGSPALLVLWLVFPGNDRYIHDPAAAGFTIKGGLLGPVPDAAIMNGQVAGLDVEADLPFVGIIVNEVFFSKEKTQD